VEIRVLGPLEVVGDDGPVPLPAAKQRQLLAALVMHAGEISSTDVLIEALWGASPPTSAAKLLQVYVSQLRKALPAPARIQTRGAGYLLELEGRSLDAARFEQLVVDGRTASREGNALLAASRLRRALGLWRGRAYGELAYEEFARAEAERLEELRLVALEERIEAELALGRHAELLPELRALAAAEPLRERMHAQAMLALYRGGRQSEALEHYAGVRAHLRDELGLEPGLELRELQRRILQHDPELLAGPDAEVLPISLPAPPNRLLGREREVEQLRELLLRDDVRLLVLVGAGGSGKTRLALEAARDTAGSFANGAVFVELAPLRDPAPMVATIARALGLEELQSEPLETLAAELRPLELLLVLDNAEHLHAAVPLFVELLARAPRLTLLVTSRVVLHLSGEHVYTVEPLAAEAAAALFHERASEADPRFRPDGTDEQAIRHICDRLDGLPLAIELAASRARTLTPTELLDRLEPRLPLLAGGPRDLPARQQTLRSTLAWSHDLLDEDKRRGLRRLSAFAGGCTLEAAEAVCDSSLDTLAALVDHNLLQHTTTPAGSRYTMLETIREYAAERLEESPEVEDVRRRHAEFFLAVAESANLNPGKLASGGQHLGIAIAEQDNARAALTWTLMSRSIELGFRLAIALDMFWTAHDPREGMRWFGALLASPEAETVAPELRAHAFRGFGASSDIAGDVEAAEQLYEQGLALFLQLGDESGRAVLLHRLGHMALRRGELKRARELVEASHEIHTRRGDRWGLTQTVGTLGAIARDSGDAARAFELIGQSAAIAREVGVLWWESGMLAELACLSLNAGRVDESEMRARESLALAEQLGDRAGCVFGVGLGATVAAERGQLERAGRLWGAIEDEDAGAPLGGWRRHRQTCEALIRKAAGPGFERGRAEGRALTLDDAVALALEPESARRVVAPKTHTQGSAG
jgi:predicted ATPase/DNA-binding SARP family transcriptional activator